MECCRALTVPTPPVIVYYTNLVVDERPDAAAVWQVADIEFVMMTLVRPFDAAERGLA